MHQKDVNTYAQQNDFCSPFYFGVKKWTLKQQDTQQECHLKK